MKSLYLRVWLTVVVVLALFAMGSGWLAQRHVQQERERLIQQGAAGGFANRARAMGELIGQALPDADDDPAQQAAALRGWSERLRLPLALDDASGRRIATSAAFERRMADGSASPPVAIALVDGRTLWMMRGARPDGAERLDRADRADRPYRADRLPASPPPAWTWPWSAADPVRSGGGLVAVLAALFLAVALGAYPVVRRLTRRLAHRQQGGGRFGSG
ncbi:MAG: two-component sensor histidine kinase, partial [Burkholderiaceae bacterium]